MGSVPDPKINYKNYPEETTCRGAVLPISALDHACQFIPVFTRAPTPQLQTTSTHADKLVLTSHTVISYVKFSHRRMGQFFLGG